MNIKHLAIFHAVAEAGSISRGAERLHISQPAVSKQLRELEDRMGMRLFDRLPKGVRLTEAGRILAVHAGRLFAIAAEAERAIEEFKGLRAGRIAVGASAIVGNYLLPAAFTRFRRTHPGVDLSLEIADTARIQRKLLENEIDLGLTEGVVDHPELEARVFMRDELVAIAAPDHPLTCHGPVAAAVLCREPMVMHEPGSATRTVMERTLAGLRLHPRVAMSLGSTEAVKRAVAAGAGVGIVSRLTVESELAAGTLALVPLSDLNATRPLHCVHLRQHHDSPAANAFLDLLQGLGHTTEGAGIARQQTPL